MNNQIKLTSNFLLIYEKNLKFNYELKLMKIAI